MFYFRLKAKKKMKKKKEREKHVILYTIFITESISQILCYSCEKTFHTSMYHWLVVPHVIFPTFYTIFITESISVIHVKKNFAHLHVSLTCDRKSNLLTSVGFTFGW